MSGIQRWECRVATNANGRPYVDDIEYAAGRYVLHSDHESEVARLRAELQNATKAALDAVALSFEKEREADALRVDAMRYRWLRNEAYKVDEMTPAVILAEAGFPVDDSRTDGFVFEDELDERVDAAMGADALPPCPN